jgi:hypothetical protein
VVDQHRSDPVAVLHPEFLDQQVGDLADPVVEGLERQLDTLAAPVVVPGQEGLVAVAPGLALGQAAEALEPCAGVLHGGAC